jgi:hypothetical protein
MQIFISYARVDKHYCNQIVERLDGAYKIWYDHYLIPGRVWEEEISNKIIGCDAFLYLLSPESVASENCLAEYRLAMQHKIKVIPVLIQEGTDLPEALKVMQYVDLKDGLDDGPISALFRALILTERELDSRPRLAPQPDALGKFYESIAVKRETWVQEYQQAQSRGDLDRALQVLIGARDMGFQYEYISINRLIEDTAQSILKDGYHRDAKREYAQLVNLVRSDSTRTMGCEFFNQFRARYPDHDPMALAKLCRSDEIPMIEFLKVSEASISVNFDKSRAFVYAVEPFLMAKYPITNAQYALFLQASDGYEDLQWWSFNLAAQKWRKSRAKPEVPAVRYGDHPRARVSWYDAVAFTNWLSARLRRKIALPSVAQWHRAALGNTKNYYAYGPAVDVTKMNCNKSNIGTTTPVTRYESAASPFGIVDMAGNVWEWTLTVHPKSEQTSTGEPKRIAKGGSYTADPIDTRTQKYLVLAPSNIAANVGFRVVANS